jgi:membrane protein DedA with SNARE-associated domain
MREHTGTSLGIAAIATFGYTIWAAVIAISMWLGLTIYAIVKAIGAPEDHASALTVLLLMLGDVALFVVLLAVAIMLAGRPMRYRKRRDDSALAR